MKIGVILQLVLVLGICCYMPVYGQTSQVNQTNPYVQQQLPPIPNMVIAKGMQATIVEVSAEVKLLLAKAEISDCAISDDAYEAAQRQIMKIEAELYGPPEIQTVPQTTPVMLTTVVFTK